MRPTKPQHDDRLPSSIILAANDPTTPTPRGTFNSPQSVANSNASEQLQLVHTTSTVTTLRSLSPKPPIASPSNTVPIITIIPTDSPGKSTNPELVDIRKQLHELDITLQSNQVLATDAHIIDKNQISFQISKQIWNHIILPTITTFTEPHQDMSTGSSSEINHTSEHSHQNKPKQLDTDTTTTEIMRMIRPINESPAPTATHDPPTCTISYINHALNLNDPEIRCQTA